jgi:MoaE-MoaD fusion protein
MLRPREGQILLHETIASPSRNCLAFLYLIRVARVRHKQTPTKNPDFGYTSRLIFNLRLRPLTSAIIHPVKLNILFFANHRRSAGVSETVFETTDGATVQSVSSQIAAQFNLELRGSMVAVNDAYAEPDTVLIDGDTLAFIPPVSGGALEDVFVVSEQPLELHTLHTHLLEPQWGGQAMFTGSTRSPNKNETIVHLEYEAHSSFCLAEMQRIALEAHGRFGLGRIVMAHRTGTVLPGEVSIFIGAASAHRQACLEAVPWMLDQAKIRLPVWKLEITQNGERWVEGSVAAATLA